MSLRVELGLREKIDQDGTGYLFAPIPLINCVCFVFEEPPRNRVRRAKLVIRPYEGRREAAGYAATWTDDEPPREHPPQNSTGTPPPSPRER